MKYKVRWTPNAYLDFAQISFFIKENWGNKAVEEFINKVDNTINIISLFPQIGKIIQLQKHIRGMLISRQTKIVYRIKTDNIIILNLFDNRQNPDKLKINESVVTYKAE